VTGASAAQFRALHSCVVDAILAQEPDVAGSLYHLFGGLSSQRFRRAVYETGVARIRSAIEDDRLRYCVDVLTDTGWVVLTRPPATTLGLEDTAEARDIEIQWHLTRLLDGQGR